MTDPLDGPDFQARLQRLDALLQEMERLGDPAARSRVGEIVQTLLEMHAVGLGRILEHVEAGGDAGAAILDACARDDVAGGLLLLHDLHPLGLVERVHRALEQVRPLLRSHGGNVELLGVEDGVVRLKLLGSCHGCASSSATMKQTIEEAIVAKAPDALGLVVEGVVESPSMTPDGRPLVVLSVP
jgi:Fe-S cluster biogenesis protein NfuA